MAHIFISYAREDREQVLELYRRLKLEGLRLWMDEFDILPGQDWEAVIRSAIKNANLFLACLSNHSVHKRGVVQKEIKLALDILDEFPENQVFVIPVCLGHCVIPERLAKLHWIDLFAQGGYEKLVRSLSTLQIAQQPVDDDALALQLALPSTGTQWIIHCNILMIRVRQGQSQLLLKRISSGDGSGSFTVPCGNCQFEESLQHCAKQILLKETGAELVESRPISLVVRRIQSWQITLVGVLGEKFSFPRQFNAAVLWAQWGWYDVDHLPSPLLQATEIAVRHYLKDEFSGLKWDEVQSVQDDLIQPRLFD